MPRCRSADGEEPADLVALNARARRTGCTVEEARDRLAGEDVGRCIRTLHKADQDRRDLLDVWQSVSAARRNFVTRYLSLAESAQSSSLPMLPDKLQIDPSLHVDLRTTIEKAIHARAVWLGCEASMARLRPTEFYALKEHLEMKGAAIWCSDTHKPTWAGSKLVAALKSLHALRRG
jgi:hypothetical protein